MTDAGRDLMPMANLLAGRRALVTGAGGGIGSAAVEVLHGHGASVVALGRSDSVRTVADRIGSAGPPVTAIVCDLSNRARLIDAFAEAVDALKAVDILVACHGHVTVENSDQVRDDSWDRTIETNLTSAFRLCRLAYTGMRAQGYGKIALISSMYAFFGGLRVAAYAASKGAVAN